MTDFVLIYSTTATASEARSIARVLLTEKLIACANIIPSITSLYEWRGEIKEENEAVLLCKTSKYRCKAAQQRIVELHSYECPSVVILPIEFGNEQYLNWMAAQVIP